MWQLYQTAKATNSRPSELVSVKGVVKDYWRGKAGHKVKADASWETLQFDNAVVYVGMVIENALHEREEVGSGNNKRWKAKYTLKQLLDPAFRLPSQATQTGNFDAFKQLIKPRKA